MSDAPPPQEEILITAEGFDDLMEALECLYIRCNLSGRLNFLQEWPVLAHFLFDPDLIRFDSEGCDDRDVRAILEDEAEEKRLQMMQNFASVADRSAVEGVLQKDYVQSFIDRYGLEISRLVYAPHVMEKFEPPPVQEAAATDDAGGDAVVSDVSIETGLDEGAQGGSDAGRGQAGEE